MQTTIENVIGKSFENVAILSSDESLFVMQGGTVSDHVHNDEIAIVRDDGYGFRTNKANIQSVWTCNITGGEELTINLK